MGLPWDSLDTAIAWNSSATGHFHGTAMAVGAVKVHGGGMETHGIAMEVHEGSRRPTKYLI